MYQQILKVYIRLNYNFCSICRFQIPEVRQEAVQQALAAMQGRPKPSLPMPSKRTSVNMTKSPERPDRPERGRNNVHQQSNNNQSHHHNIIPPPLIQTTNLDGFTGPGDSSSDEDSVATEESPGAGGPPGTGLSDTSSTGSARDTPPPPRPPARRPPAQDITDIPEYSPNAYCNLVQTPDVTHTTTQSRRQAGELQATFSEYLKNNSPKKGIYFKKV